MALACSTHQDRTIWTRTDMCILARNHMLFRRCFLLEVYLCFQLGDKSERILKHDFLKYEEREEKLKIVVMELGMMFDLLYTETNLLQRWTRVVFRSASQTMMVLAFLLCLIIDKGADNHNRVNVAITYTLFTGAMFMEAYSVAAVMASPWTRAHVKEGSFLHGLCNFATSLFKAVHCNKRHRTLSSTSMGQFNFVDYGMSMKCKPTILSKAFRAIGLDKQWRNLWYIHHIDDDGRASEGIISGVMEIIGKRTSEFWFSPQYLGRGLASIMGLPFEHALFRLHILTDLHISRPFVHTHSDDLTPAPDDVRVRVMRLTEECEMLSNYMMYLMVVYPSMFAINTGSADFEPAILKWVSRNQSGDNGGTRTRLQILEHYTNSGIKPASSYSCYPFETEQIIGSFNLEKSLQDVKEMWLRLLMYAAGKCSGEVHARQLSEGGELITFVWLLMVHHGHGDVARELILVSSNRSNLDKTPYLASVGNEYKEWHNWAPVKIFDLTRSLEHYASSCEGGTSGEATPSEIDDKEDDQIEGS